MMARDRRYGTRRTSRKALKARVGIATAVLAGGGVTAAAVVMATSHPAGTAQSAAYSARFNNEGAALNSAVREWNSSRGERVLPARRPHPGAWIQPDR